MPKLDCLAKPLEIVDADDVGRDVGTVRRAARAAGIPEQK
jgi:hypothetical protein